MSQVINTNVASLNAQRNLQMSQTTLATSLQRLSSGLRINSAKDDAAGLAISDRFTTQIRGLNQAVRNANDGISLAQVGESALAEVTSNLQRIRELAVQSANATNSASDRVALDLEVQQRLAEIDRIAGQTAFNGRRILDGSFGNAAFQIGANVGETINVGLDTSMRRDSIGAVATATSVDLSTLIGETDGTAATFTLGDITATDYSTTGQTDATMALGAFTAGAGGDADSTYTIEFEVSGGATLTVTATADTNGDLTATELAAGFVAAGFAADGTGTVNGFTLDLGGEADIEAAIAADSLTVLRTDGANFSATETLGGTAFATTDPAFANTATTTDGDEGDTSANRTLSITVPGGSTSFDVLLNSNIEDADDLLAAITGTAGYADAGFTAAVVDGAVVFTASAVGAGEFTATTGDPDDDALLGLAADDVTSVAGTAAGTLSLTLAEGDLTIQLGDGTALDIVGTFTTQQQLVNEINRQLGSDASATIADNVLSFTSGENITIGGTRAADVFADGEGTIEVSGSLATVNVLSVENSNDAISRIDAALTAVSELRSSFGALQNRFESTIANLQASSENLSASRSRILDADFAAETANLTRAQILQQAGVAMLAQANALPQNVLSLLR